MLFDTPAKAWKLLYTLDLPEELLFSSPPKNYILSVKYRHKHKWLCVLYVPANTLGHKYGASLIPCHKF